MENKKDKIIELFFISHLSVKEIADSIGTSSAYITKIIKTDERYVMEKQYRKEKSKEKRKKDKNNFMKNKREQNELMIIILLFKHNIIKQQENYLNQDI